MQSRVREREGERELSLLYLFRTSVSQSGSKATTRKYCRRKEALAFIMITVGKNWNCCCPHSYNPPTLLPSIQLKEEGYIVQYDKRMEGMEWHRGRTTIREE